MRATAAAFGLLLLAPGFANGATPAIGYAQATGYFKKDSRPTLYQPLNLLDGREATAWCSSSADPLNELLTFGFKGPVKIDEVRIYTGNGFDEQTFKEFSRARKLLLKGPSTAQSITLADQRGQQAVVLNPPLQGAQFTLQIQDQFPADDPEAPVCLTDVVFYADGRALNGPWLTRSLKYDRAQAPLLGTWFGGSEGAPDKFLSFYFDNTYRFTYEPWDPGMKGEVFEGEYDATGSRLTLVVPKKGKVTARIHRGTGKSESGQALRTLTLEGDLPAALKTRFRDRL
ncbi:MAG: discoidin domain-containing protein [Myxococcaceae bacterium]|nr:discoidin domain-containing protein [Myxococcaceae bacterium]